MTVDTASLVLFGLCGLAIIFLMMSDLFGPEHPARHRRKEVVGLMVYVFDWRTKSGYVCRVPLPVAWLLCRFNRRWDYAPTEGGY